MTEDKVVAPESGSLQLLELVLLIAENARLLVMGTVLGGLVGFAISSIQTPLFTASTRILPPQQQSVSSMISAQLGSLSNLAGITGISIKNPADTYVALIRSRSVADRLVERFDLVSAYGVESRTDARKRLDRRTQVTAGKDGLVTIEVDDEDPKRSAAMANSYVEELKHLTRHLAITEAKQRRLFFEEQIRQAGSNLATAQSALATSKGSESLINVEPQVLVSGIAQLKAQIGAREVALAAMRSYLTEDSPQYRRAKIELDQLRAQLSQMDRLKAPSQGEQMTYVSRYRDFKYHEAIFELLTKQYEIARLDEAREGADVQVVDAGIPPERKSKPRRIIVAILSSVGVGLVLFLFILLKFAIRQARTSSAGAQTLMRLEKAIRSILRGR